jgi:hypothetical protein
MKVAKSLTNFNQIQKWGHKRDGEKNVCVCVEWDVCTPT